MKFMSISVAFLGVCILISAWILSNAISHSETQFPHSINVDQTGMAEYELIVQDEWLYLYNKIDGQVWKKVDNSESTWESVKHYTDY